MTFPGEIIDDAVAALGGEDTTFFIRAGMINDGTPKARPCFSVNCGFGECEWGFTIGEIEVWEIVSDCRSHWEEEHDPAIA